MNWIKSCLFFFARMVFQGLFRVKVTGDLAVLRRPGPKVIVANHGSFLDAALIRLFLPVDPVFVVHTSVAANPLFKPFLTLSDHIAVDTASPMAMRTLVRHMLSGRTVVIFPEGRLTLTGSLMKIYEGPAFAVLKAGAEVVPIRLTGVERSRFSRVPLGYPRQWFPRLSVSVLPAVKLTAPEAATAKARRHEAGEILRRLMQQTIFQAEPSNTLIEAMIQAGETFGKDRIVLEDALSDSLSYQKLVGTALVMGRWLEKDTEAKATVGVLLPNTTKMLATVLGLGARGRLPALLNYSAGIGGVKAACEVAAIETVVTSRSFLQKLGSGNAPEWKNLVNELLGVKVVYLEDLRATHLAWPQFPREVLLAQWATRFPRTFIQTVTPEQPAVVLFTSGSEGTPKGVVLSHRALLANVAQIRAVIDVSPLDKMFNALPMFHAFGFTVGTLLPLFAGASAYLHPTPLHYKVIPELFYDKRCTLMVGTNTFLGHYGKHAHAYDFHRLRYVVAGAEKLTDAVAKLWFKKFGIRILEGYGATEAAPVLAVNTPMAYREGTVGELLPGIEARLQPVPGIETGGRLHVRGPNLMSGYLTSAAPGVLMPPATGFGAGWHDTGDIVNLDGRFVSITGRAKRFAKISGEMVSLDAVEKLAYGTSPDASHAVISVSSVKKGEALVLFTTDAGLDVQRLLVAAKTSRFTELGVPKKIVHLSQMPVLSTGKTDYRALQAVTLDLEAA